MRPLAKQLYQQVEEFYRSVYDRMATIAEAVQQCTDMEELADYAYAWRECEKYLKQLGVRARANQEMCERMAVALAIKKEDVGLIRTKYCTATPDIKMIGRVPKLKDDPEGYRKLMEWLGIPEPVWNVDPTCEHPAVQVHWPGLVELVTKKLAAGEQPPEGMDVETLRPIFRLIIRKKKGILED